ncbi:MAG: hypothetical protein ABJA86_08815 [Nocardioidaceae bacterium]
MYDVVLLIEQALSALDAEQITGLHSGIEEPVSYHVLLPVEDASGRVEATLGTLAAGEVLASSALVGNETDLADLQKEIVDTSRESLATSLEALKNQGVEAAGEVTTKDPVEALIAAVQAFDARETIILTRPHLVAEFFHFDWTSRARRKLGVPVLHLLEHEGFAEQAGGGEGVSGL